MIGSTPALDGRLIGAVLAGLFFFGLAYNALMHYLDGKKDGYTAFLVVAGVLITLGGAALISWQAAVLCLVCFVASGIPMIVGDIYRAIKRREQAIARIKQEIHDKA